MDRAGPDKSAPDGCKIFRGKQNWPHRASAARSEKKNV
jgi:hypothetical protein